MIPTPGWLSRLAGKSSHLVLLQVWIIPIKMSNAMSTKSCRVIYFPNLSTFCGRRSDIVGRFRGWWRQRFLRLHPPAFLLLQVQEPLPPTLQHLSPAALWWSGPCLLLLLLQILLIISRQPSWWIRRLKNSKPRGWGGKSARKWAILNSPPTFTLAGHPRFETRQIISSSQSSSSSPSSKSSSW